MHSHRLNKVNRPADLLRGAGARRFLTVAMAATMACLSVAQTQLYVSTAGKDSWSGLLASANGAGTDGPKASLYGARDAIRKLKTAGTLSSLGAVVNVASGTYPIMNYLDIQAVDS